MTKEEWIKQGTEIFGADQMTWKFVCPVCGYVQSVADYKEAGAPFSAVAFSCIGRYLKTSRDAFSKEGDGPCNYAGGGLLKLNPVEVDGERYFDFAR